jgi:hypothetical protein
MQMRTRFGSQPRCLPALLRYTRSCAMSRRASMSRPASRECSRYSMSFDTSVAAPRLKSTPGQVQHMNRWFDREQSDWQLRMAGQRTAPQAVHRRPGTPGATGHVHGGHLVSSADIGWMVGHKQNGTPSGPPAALARSKLARTPAPLPSAAFARPRTSERPRLTMDVMDKTLSQRHTDLGFRESSLGPGHHQHGPASLMPSQRSSPLLWAGNLPSTNDKGGMPTGVGFGGSHGRVGETWASNAWRNPLTTPLTAKHVVQRPSSFIGYEQSPANGAGGEKEHGGMLAARCQTFFYNVRLGS